MERLYLTVVSFVLYWNLVKARIVHAAPETNPGKLRKLDELHAAYVAYAQSCLDRMILDHRPSVPLTEHKAYFPASEVLSSHIVKNVKRQVVALVETWVKGVYARKLKTYIKRDKTFTEQQKIELYCCGKYLVTKPGKLGKGEISQASLDLFWSWVWDPKISGNPPTITNRLPIILSEMTCWFGKSEDSKKFGWWIKVSSLERYKTIKVPLAFNPYLKVTSKFANTVIAKKRCGKWSFQFVDKAEAAKLDGTQGTIGLDVGLNSLASTSDGRLYGRDLKPRFDKLYKKTRDCRANRQRQGFKEDSHRLARLEQRLTGMTKTETGRITNKLVKDFPDHTFVIEDLDLRGCRGQKRFAYRQLHRSLESKAVVKAVNPAYTSQMCPSCGYVSRRNRAGVKFTCHSCGRKSHADVVGGINLLRRSEDKQVGLYDHPSDVKTFLRARYRHRRNIASDQLQNEPQRLGRRLTTRVLKGSGTASNDLEVSQ